MSNMFLIGEISKLFQIDIRTLRYYDEIDLFKPTYVEDQTGYRYYSINQFERLNTILYLKALDIPLKEIKKFLDNREIDEILNLLREQQRRTEEKIQKFNHIHMKIRERIQQIEDVSKTEDLFKMRETWFPDRPIIMLKQKIHRNENLEMPIRFLENSNNLKSSIFLGQVGLTISIKELELGNNQEYNSLFVFVNPDIQLNFDSSVKCLPKNKYLTFRFVGTHADAAPYYEKLLVYIKQCGYSVVDDVIEITYIDYGLTNNISRFVTEIQIPLNH